MSDYKELISKLRMAGEYVKTKDGGYETYLLSCGECKEIADAIEQLVRERDAAVSDLTYLANDPNAPAEKLRIRLYTNVLNVKRRMRKIMIFAPIVGRRWARRANERL